MRKIPTGGIEPLSALLRVRDFVRGTGALDAATVSWFARACDAVFAGEIRSFDRALGLKPGVGKSNETPWARTKQTAVAKAILTLTASVPGGAASKAKAVSRWLNGKEVPPGARERELVADIQKSGLDLPTSQSRLYEVIRAGVDKS